MKELEPLTSSAAEVESLAEYRPVSRLAILSLVLGLCSALAFADPLLIVVPVMSAGVAAYTLFHIQRSRFPVYGRSAAMAALMLSVLFGGWTAARHWTRQQQLYAEGAEIGRRWLELLRDKKYYEAHQLHLSQYRRAAPGKPLESIYEDPIHGSANFSTFQKEFLTDMVKEIEPTSTVRWLQNEQAFRNGNSDFVVQRFAIEGTRDGSSRTLVFEVVMKRTPMPHLRESQWEVVRISNQTDK